MKKTQIIFFFIILLFACKTNYTLSDVSASQQKFTSDYLKQDTIIELVIEPYRNTLDQTMNEVLVVSSKNLLKAKPESELGNLLADATLVMAEKYTNEKVDLAIINYGGIRVPSINKGNVTLGNVYELMPFDNYIVVLKLSGNTLKLVCDKIAEGGGWPISGLSFIIANSLATNIKVGGSPLIDTNIYNVAISDYLANGGDQLSMLIDAEQNNTNVLIRDAFIAYFKMLNTQGEELNAQLENRISNE